MKMSEEILEKILENYLDDASFEDFLEEFNVTPLEAIICLYRGGLIDDLLLEGLIPSDA